MGKVLFFCSCHVDPSFTTLVVERLIEARRDLPADEARVAYATEFEHVRARLARCRSRPGWSAGLKAG